GAFRFPRLRDCAHVGHGAFLPRALKSREVIEDRDSRENADDRHDYEQLDQREAPAAVPPRLPTTHIRILRFWRRESDDLTRCCSTSSVDSSSHTALATAGSSSPAPAAPTPRRCSSRCTSSDATSSARTSI